MCQRRGPMCARTRSGLFGVVAILLGIAAIVMGLAE
jgi:hypothetical protein